MFYIYSGGGEGCEEGSRNLKTTGNTFQAVAREADSKGEGSDDKIKKENWSDVTTAWDQCFEE